MRILRVNMSNLEAVFEDLPKEWEIIGGRGLSAKILGKEVSPKTDPLGSEAKLVIATGPLAGTLAPSCGRISVGAKSPLTLGIKEANSGGPAGQKLDKLDIRAIVIEGAAEEGKCFLLNINQDGTSLVSADQYKGMKNYELVDALHNAYDEKATVISIGIAGERLWKSAAVTLTDKDGHCSRHAARGGLGAVMGSKGLKAIVIDDQGTSRVDIANKDVFRDILKAWAPVIKEDQSIQGMSTYGTPGIIVPLRSQGSMPAFKYGSDSLEIFETHSGQNNQQKHKERRSKMDTSMPVCLDGSSVVYSYQDGPLQT